MFWQDARFYRKFNVCDIAAFEGLTKLDQPAFIKSQLLCSGPVKQRARAKRLCQTARQRIGVRFP